jgi:hypothetical protein
MTGEGGRGGKKPVFCVFMGLKRRVRGATKTYFYMYIFFYLIQIPISAIPCTRSFVYTRCEDEYVQAILLERCPYTEKIYRLRKRLSELELPLAEDPLCGGVYVTLYGYKFTINQIRTVRANLVLVGCVSDVVNNFGTVYQSTRVQEGSKSGDRLNKNTNLIDIECPTPLR